MKIDFPASRKYFQRKFNIIKPDEKWILPKALRQGLREALDGGDGRLRMDPQDLAELLGSAIDGEVDRLAQIRKELERKNWLKKRLASAEQYVAGNGRSPVVTEHNRTAFEAGVCVDEIYGNDVDNETENGR